MRDKIDAIMRSADALNGRLDSYAKRRADAASRSEQYISLLEANLGKPGFWDVYRQLEKDLDMKAKDKITVAKEFFVKQSYASAKEAMRAIASRQENIEGTKARAAATNGRTAA